MGIITKNARKYKYIVGRNAKNYNSFFDGVVWTAENIDGLEDYVRLSSVERSEDKNVSAVSRKIVTIPKTKLMTDFTKICGQDIQPEFKKNDAVNCASRAFEGAGTADPHRAQKRWWVAFDPGEEDDNCDEDEVNSWWSNMEIERFMKNYDVDHSLLWTDKDISRFVKDSCSAEKNDNPKKEPDYDKCYGGDKQDARPRGAKGCRGKSEIDECCDDLLCDMLKLLYAVSHRSDQ
jgi:hypothetical protein